MTITARRVDPAALLEQVAAATGQRTLESIAFDGESAAVELALQAATSGHQPQDVLPLDPSERDRIVRMLEALHADPAVQDMLLESHVDG